jgi:hypothetical protein
MPPEDLVEPNPPDPPLIFELDERGTEGSLMLTEPVILIRHASRVPLECTFGKLNASLSPGSFASASESEK